MLYNVWKVRFLLLLYALFFAVPLYLFFGRNPDTFGTYRVGQFLGVAGITALTLQLVLTSRMMFLERGVGHDRLTRLHRTNGLILMCALVLHPTLLFWNNLTSFSKLWESVSSYTIYHYLGVAALLLIFVQVGTTIVLRMNYEHWKIIHKTGYIIILLGFVHSLFLGSDVGSRGPLFQWWIFLAGVAAYAFAYRNMYRPSKWKNSWYRIEKIVKETADVASIYMKPEHQPIFNYRPGQFAFVRFASEKVPQEEHHFTLSFAPGQDHLAFTIKVSGDFTTLLRWLKVGERARLEGPYGVFSADGMKGPFVFIAGGIGITPLMSNLRAMVLAGRKEPTTLIYVASTLGDLVFKQELDTLAKKNTWLKVVYVLSKEKRAGFYEGRLSKEILEKEVGKIEGKWFFVCGPPPMMSAAVSLLKQLGVNKNKIFTERFALR